MNGLLVCTRCVSLGGQKQINYFFICVLVSQAIFASEKIEDVIPLAPNAILILGQGNLWISYLKYSVEKKCFRILNN